MEWGLHRDTVTERGTCIQSKWKILTTTKRPRIWDEGMEKRRRSCCVIGDYELPAILVGIGTRGCDGDSCKGRRFLVHRPNEQEINVHCSKTQEGT